MNKQQLLDKENAQGKEWAAQQLLTRMSMTRLEAVRRVIGEITTLLYKTSARQMPYQDVADAVDLATKLSKGEVVDPELKPDTIPQTNKKVG